MPLPSPSDLAKLAGQQELKSKGTILAQLTPPDKQHKVPFATPSTRKTTLSAVVTELSLGTAARSSHEVHIQDHALNKVERHHYSAAVVRSSTD